MIVKESGPKGAEHVIEGTRIPVWYVYLLMKQGGLPNVFAHAVALTAEDVAEAMFWAEEHTTEVSAQLAANRFRRLGE